MLLNFKTSMFKSFEDMVELSMESNKGKNTHVHNGKSILKSSIIYGANNSGKSNFIMAINWMKRIFKDGSLKRFPFNVYKNYFFENAPIEFEVEFVINKNNYVYGFDIYNQKKLSEYLLINENSAFNRGVPNEKNSISDKYFTNDFIKSSFHFLNDDELFVTKALSYKDRVKGNYIKDINAFFNKIKFYDNNSIASYVDLVLECLENEKDANFFNKLLAKADVSLKGKAITDNINLGNLTEEQILKEMRKNSHINNIDLEKFMKSLKVKSIYERNSKKVEIPTLYDSIGTNKFSNLVLLMMRALKNGEILFIDEIDNSLHYRLTRELIKLMNADENKQAQFIMTAHDVKLLTPLIFRKEQINFIDRGQNKLDMFSLDEFKDIRNTTNFENLYMKNSIGALPIPELEEVLKEWE